MTDCKEAYPIHYAVFCNDVDSLSKLLEITRRHDIDKLDIHGRTPLMLATTLNHVECGELLLQKGASANVHNRRMWALSHEAVNLGNESYLKKVLNYRDYQRACDTLKILLDLRESLKGLADFYVEMSWEFTSWLRFVKNMCPSDTYKIYKSGSKIRIDTTLKDLDSNKRGNHSFIFQFTEHDNAEIIYLNFSESVAHVQTIDLKASPRLEDFEPTDNLVAEKLDSPITTSYIDVENVGFERSKSSALLSWFGSSAEKQEEVEGFMCRVFNASNVEIVTKTIIENLRKEDQQQYMDGENKILSILMGLFEKKKSMKFGSMLENAVGSAVTGGDFRGGLSAEQYLTDALAADKIGKRISEIIRSNSFNASLYLADCFPLNLQEQIFPIIDLMSVRNAKFLRLKNFIQLQLPSGFPVRVSIPLFHMINAQITFRNVNQPSAGDLLPVLDDLGLPVFRLKAALFEIPQDFTSHRSSLSLLFDILGHTEMNDTTRPAATTPATTSNRRARYNAVDVDDDYVYLLERFMNDADFNSIQGTSPLEIDYRTQLQLAIERSIASEQNTNTNDNNEVMLQQNIDYANYADPELLVDDVELAEVLRLSAEEEEQRKRDAQREEEELAKAIELSRIQS